MDRDISPPPAKRRRVVTEDAENSVAEHGRNGDGQSTAMRFARIFSWNVNGVQPLLPKTTAPITSFFRPVNQGPIDSKQSRTATSLGLSQPGNALRGFLQRHRWPEVLFLQEIKISPADKRTPAALLSAVNTSLGDEDALVEHSRYQVDVNLPRDKYNARGFGGKLYGVGTILREDFAERHVSAIRHAEWDLEGRVTIVELRSQIQSSSTCPRSSGKVPRSLHGSFRPLALVNVYAVNGTSAPYRSPDTGKAIGTRHDHKLNFHERLRDECLDLEDRGFEVVIAGDLNIARGRLDGWPSLRTYPRQHCLNRADFNTNFFGADDNVRAQAYLGDVQKLSTEGRGKPLFFDGVDVFRALRGGERKYTYHPPRADEEWGSSCDRVDLIVASRRLVSDGRVDDTDILDSPQERATSDHVPLWVKITLGQAGG